VTATFFLVRHAVHPGVGKVLAGRMPGVNLCEEGCTQANRLASHLTRQAITAVQSSPRERAMQTATPIARMAGLPLQVIDDLDELDTGEWTGCRFAALRDDPRWQLWNTKRAETRPPGGESMQSLQGRTLAHVEDLCAEQPYGRIVLVSHAEPIRSLLLHCLGKQLNDFAQVDVAPAAISTVVADGHDWRVLALNEMATP
jgi:probable phosphoglycerate mutase